MKKKEGILLLFAALLLGGLGVVAQEGDSQDEAEPAPEEQPITPRMGEDEGLDLDDIFIPSDEVQAAEELAFPVNI